MTFKDMLIAALADDQVITAMESALILHRMEHPAPRVVEITSTEDTEPRYTTIQDVRPSVETLNFLKPPCVPPSDAQAAVKLVKATYGLTICVECKQDLMPYAPRELTMLGPMCMPCYRRTSGETAGSAGSDE